MNTEYKLRSGFIFLLFCAIYLIIVIHLYSLQIWQRGFYHDLADQQYKVTLKTTPPRALIYDRNGTPLAVNKDSIAAFLLPKLIKDRKKVVEFLKNNFPHALERFEKNRQTNFFYIKRRLVDEEIELIEKADLEDIKLLKEPSRFYPVQAAGSIVGITDIDNHGRFGIEAIFDKQLTGLPTTVCLEKDARSGKFYFKKETKEEGVDGVPINLTIDGDLQYLVTEELEEVVTSFGMQEGQLIIVDPTTGRILAMTSYPNFDPNNTKKLDVEYTKNKVLTDCHELGSVMKAFVALGLLEENLIDPDEEIDCENKKVTYLDGIRVTTVKPHGVQSFTKVIQTSNNIGMVKAARRIGEKLYDHYKKLGFGTKTEVFWPGQQTGFINHPKNWSRLSLASLSYGYEITGTLLQLARAFCIVAHNGILIEPHLIQKTTMLPERIYSECSVLQLQDMLEKTVMQGTARRAKLNGYRVMGKTGTANMVVGGKYSPKNNVYTFAGIVEKGDYKRVVVTFVKNANRANLYASQVAVPLFEKVANRMLIHEKVL